MKTGLIILTVLAGVIVSPVNAQTSPAQSSRLPLAVLPHVIAICRLVPDAALPGWATMPSLFLTVSRTADELSITTVQSNVPSTVQCERDYRAIRVQGPLPLNLIGILASIANPLADAGVSIFAISTYDTDYVLVKGAVLDSAVTVLRRAGHTVTREDAPGL
jgi:hypothetical protein